MLLSPLFFLGGGGEYVTFMQRTVLTIEKIPNVCACKNASKHFTFRRTAQTFLQVPPQKSILDILGSFSCFY